MACGREGAMRTGGRIGGGDHGHGGTVFAPKLLSESDNLESPAKDPGDVECIYAPRYIAAGCSSGMFCTFGGPDFTENTGECVKGTSSENVAAKCASDMSNILSGHLVSNTTKNILRRNKF